MGICLDTEQQNGSKVFEEGDDIRGTGRWRGEAGLLATPPDGQFPMQNVGQVKFETPKVPVIFVLGGPGSGKVTHCDNLMQEKKGITHINMTDLLQQYTLGNDMQDFGLLSSKTVTEVLMLEIKMSPGAKTFLVSGYPRNMRDVVEYSEKIQIVNGVVLVSWRKEVLERQIDYGAQLGQVILELARMELHNFYRNVMPVAEYFDQSGVLLAVNGERNPSEVYVDFREAVLRILGMSDDENRGRAAPESTEAEVQVERREGVSNFSPVKQVVVVEMSPPLAGTNLKPSKTADKPRKGIPSFIWVIGGPGSNKATLCNQAVRNMPGWVHVSIGGLLRNMASSNSTVNEAIVAGEMVPRDIVMQVVEQQVLLNRDTDGIVIDGFPRDLNQVQEFENKFNQEPPLILLDCSKLQLGRGRLDDSVSAFRKRLELFREMSLPMLKTLDNDNRLTIVDGDTDVFSVQQEFASSLYQHMQHSRRKEEENRRDLGLSQNANDENHPNSLAPDNINGGQGTVNNEDIVPNGVAKQMVRNGVNNLVNHVDKETNKSVQSYARNMLKDNTTRSITSDVSRSGADGQTVGQVLNNIANNLGGRVGNGIDSISRKVQDVTDGRIAQIANGGGRVANGVLNNVKQSVANGGASVFQNGGVFAQHGAASGAKQLLQNGVAHLANGISTNKVAPSVRNSITNNVRDPVRNMYNEVEGYQQDLHI